MAWVDSLARRGSSSLSDRARLVDQLECTAREARRLRAEGEAVNYDASARVAALRQIEVRCARKLELLGHGGDHESVGGGGSSATGRTSPLSPKRAAVDLQRALFGGITVAWEAAMAARSSEAEALEASNHAVDRCAASTDRADAESLAALNETRAWKDAWEGHLSASVGSAGAGGIRGADASGGRSGDDSAESALFAAEDDVPFDVLLSAPCAIVVDDLRRRPLALSAAQVAANKAETATLTLSDLARCDVAEKWCAPEEINRGTGAKGALTNAVGGGASPFLHRSAIQKLVDRATPLRDSSRGAARGGDEGGELAVRPACAGLGPGRDPAFDELRRLVQLSAKGGVDEATSARRLGKALAGVRVSVQA